MSLTLDSIAVHAAGENVSVRTLLQLLHFEEAMQPWLRRLATRLLIRQFADETGFSVSGEQLQQAADIFRRKQKLLTTAEMTQWLERRRLSVPDFESILEDRLKRQFVFAYVTSGAREYFEANRAEWDRVQYCVVTTSREHLAEELKCQYLEEGLHPRELARMLSAHPGLGELAESRLCFRDTLPQWMKSGINGVAADSLAGPLPCPSGWALIGVEQIMPATFDPETEAAIRKHLFQQWLSARIREANVAFPLLDLLSCSNDS